MDLEIRGLNYEVSVELKEHLERRLQFALNRFADRIAGVTVRISDVNGPRGGIDKRCAIVVALLPQGAARIESAGDEPFALAARAAKRAGRAVQRPLGRRRRTRVALV